MFPGSRHSQHGEQQQGQQRSLPSCYSDSPPVRPWRLGGRGGVGLISGLPADAEVGAARTVGQNGGTRHDGGVGLGIHLSALVPVPAPGDGKQVGYQPDGVQWNQGIAGSSVAPAAATHTLPNGHGHGDRDDPYPTSSFLASRIQIARQRAGICAIPYRPSGYRVPCHPPPPGIVNNNPLKASTYLTCPLHPRRFVSLFTCLQR